MNLPSCIMTSRQASARLWSFSDGGGGLRVGCVAGKTFSSHSGASASIMRSSCASLLSMVALWLSNSALDEQAELLNQRATIDGKLAQLDRMIEALAPLCDENVLPATQPTLRPPPPSLKDQSLADACRLVMMHEGRFITPIGIRDTLIKYGYDTSKQTNLLASIHSICKRFVESGEAEKQTVAGKAFYRWNVVRVDPKRILEGLKPVTWGPPLKDALNL